MNIEVFYHQKSGTLTYLLYDPESGDCLLADPSLDFDPLSGRVFKEQAAKIKTFIQNNNLRLHTILETHPHADHMSSADYFRRQNPGIIIGISEDISVVQEQVFLDYHYPESQWPNHAPFDLLLKDGDSIQAGTLSGKALKTPGHTPACMSYIFDSYILTGDLLFFPDSGTGRCDFPGGSAQQMYKSVTEKIYPLPDDFKILPGHDYKYSNRKPGFYCTVAEQKSENIHLPSTRKSEDFIRFRENRDQQLNLPALMHHSLPVNMFAGCPPLPESNGKRYLKIPLSMDI